MHQKRLQDADLLIAPAAEACGGLGSEGYE